MSIKSTCTTKSASWMGVAKGLLIESLNKSSNTWVMAFSLKLLFYLIGTIKFILKAEIPYV